MPESYPTAASDPAARRRETLSDRQARVGIIANPAKMVLPYHPPRDVWVRWPRLRSARRAGGSGAPPVSAADPILSGTALQSFARDLREGASQTEAGSPPGKVGANATAERLRDDLQSQPPPDCAVWLNAQRERGAAGRLRGGSGAQQQHVSESGKHSAERSEMRAADAPHQLRGVADYSADSAHLTMPRRTDRGLVMSGLGILLLALVLIGLSLALR